ncbi:MAG TPA: cyclase family protein [Candidatus Saccharimonadales bacterium]|nr:cyclase family protein [Candidatus Saccharimonadales bacterium]
MTPDAFSTVVLPAYCDLPVVKGLAARSAWGVFGSDDRLGSLNLLTEARTAAAAALVRRGAVFPLGWRLELPDPPMFGRRPLRHVSHTFANGTDDHYDDFYPQGSSQWDALSHIGYPGVGFYGGRTAEAVGNPATNPLGIEWWARRGIAGRFVLADLARRREERGEPLDSTLATPIDAGELEATLADEGVAVQAGDILLLRFGWIGWYETLGRERRQQVADLGHTPTPGLAQDEAMAAWLWDHRVAAVAADNPGVEVYPADPEDLDHFLHYRLLTFLGLALGELFALDALAEDCARDGVYEGLFTAAPLNKQGGSGSTANALALK